MKSATHAACAVAGPPTRSSAIDRFERPRRVIVELEIGFLARRPVQKSRFGSFHTSKYHCETSSMP